jgi:hypothetical protein
MKITFECFKFIVAMLSFVFMVGIGAVRIFIAVLGACHTETEDSERASMEHFMRIPNGYNTDATNSHCDTLRYDDYLDSR